MVLFGERITAAQYIGATRYRHEVAARFDDLLGDDAVLVTPIANVQSWAPEGPLPTNADDPAVALNTPDINFTGHPAVSVPLGHDDAGVPFGLQVVAPRFADGLALGLAELLERERPWPTVAPDYEPYPSF
jgi:Asp-tRNA(Asn)/Glu-tRNA(Gln) amidotransferase A subunit family amidase